MGTGAPGEIKRVFCYQAHLWPKLEPTQDVVYGRIDIFYSFILGTGLLHKPSDMQKASEMNCYKSSGTETSSV